MTDRQDDSQLRNPQALVREKFVKQLKEDNFVLYSQAILPAAADSADPPLREILARYREEEENLLPPGSFLPILEDQGLLPLLDRWIVARLLAWGRSIQTGGQRMPHCSVNLSIDTLRRDEAFGDYVLQGLQKTGVSAAALTFEVLTVDALANRAALQRFIPPLRNAGVTFALSWFNGEEGEFELLQKAGFSYVKIDGAFAAVIARQPKKKAELATIVQRCRKLGVQTVCMQVEDDETLQHLRLLRVDYVQGFGVERPKQLETRLAGD
jgi:EAL domain-containing protein (putative c-di-GMP-specific phosphodiesterase class I)